MSQCAEMLQEPVEDRQPICASYHLPAAEGWQDNISRKRHLKSSDARSSKGQRGSEAPLNYSAGTMSVPLRPSRCVRRNLPPSGLESALVNPIGSHPLLPTSCHIVPNALFRIRRRRGLGRASVLRCFCSHRFERLLRFPVASGSDHLRPVSNPGLARLLPR